MGRNAGSRVAVSKTGGRYRSLLTRDEQWQLSRLCLEARYDMIRDLLLGGLRGLQGEMPVYRIPAHQAWSDVQFLSRRDLADVDGRHPLLCFLDDLIRFMEWTERSRGEVEALRETVETRFLKASDALPRLATLPPGYRQMVAAVVVLVGVSMLVVLPRPSGFPLSPSPDGSIPQSERASPIQLVRLPTGTCIARLEVNARQFADFEHAASTGDSAPGDSGPGDAEPGEASGHESAAPAAGVSHHTARAYAAWLARETGIPFRLPTANEWIDAAGGPDTARPYPWGTFEDGPALESIRYTGPLRPTGSVPLDLSPCGLFDMGSGVAEWTSTRDVKAGDELRYLVCGGSARDHLEDMELGGICGRESYPPDVTVPDIGFRLAISAEACAHITQGVLECAVERSPSSPP